MAGVKGSPAPKPSSLGKPVPGADQADEADAFLASLDMPEVPSGGGDEADSFLSGLDGSESAAPSADQFAPEPGFVQANLEQFQPKNFVDRLQAGLAANDTEKVGFLKRKYGEENVAIKGGAIYYRRDPKEKLKRLDPETLELVSDLIPDFAREIVTEAAMLPGEIGGALGGAVATGNPFGAIPGAYAGRIASVPLANEAANQLQQVAGVEMDPKRSRVNEAAWGMGAEAVIPVAGKYIAKTVAKRIPGTAAYRASREAGEREVVALSKQSQEVLIAAQALEQEGLKAPLMLHQVQPDSPKIKAMVDSVSNEGEFLNKQMEFAEGYRANLEGVLKNITERTTGGKTVRPGELAQTVTDAVAGLERAEGQAIGKYRAKAMANLGNKKVPLPKQTTTTVTDMMTELGFQRRRSEVKTITRAGSYGSMEQKGALNASRTIERQNWVPPKDLGNIEGRLGLQPGQARGLVNVLNEYGQLVTRGSEARLSDVERLIKRMGPMTQSLRGSQAGAMLGRVTSELRQHRREIIKAGLPDDTERKLFDSAMDEFSLIRSQTDQLSDVLRGDVTAKTIVSSFFKGKENLANIRALKSITGNDSPQWGALKEEFVNQLLLKHGNDGATGFNSKAFLNDLQKNYGDDFIREVLNDGKAGPNYDTVKNLLTYGKRLEATMKGVSADTADKKTKDAIADAGIGFFAGIKFKMVNGAMALIGANGSKQNTLMEIFNREGFEKYLANYKGRDKGRIAKTIEGALVQYNASRDSWKRTHALLDAGNNLIVKPGKEAAKRGTRATIREDLMRED